MNLKLTKEEQLAARGNKIYAIKIYRDRTSSDLHAARLAVELYLDNPDLYNENQDVERAVLIDKIMAEIEVLEHLNARLLSTNEPTRNTINNIQRNRNELRYDLERLLLNYEK